MSDIGHSCYECGMGCYALRLRLFLFFVLVVSALGAQDPDILYLTWKGEPSTTMMVMWHTNNGDGPKVVNYQKLSRETWRQKEGVAHRVTKSSVTVHHAELTGLEPDTDYLFRLGEGSIHQKRGQGHLHGDCRGCGQS